MSEAVTYKRHPLYTIYLIGSNGSVFSLYRNRKSILERKDKYLQTRINVGGSIKNKLVHRLVAEAFLGESSLEVNHKDKNRKNNSLDNLEYLVKSENMLHRNKGRMRFVTHQKPGGPYLIQMHIGENKRIRCPKIFKTKEEAYEVAREFYKTHFGEYPW